jgi:hypothetical protein
MVDIDINNLSKEEALHLQARILGYKKMPPSIREFVMNDYYLGKLFGHGGLYPYWMEVLEKIYPTPIHTAYPFVIYTGAIGSGKSTITKIQAMYTLCRLDHLDNFDYFGVVITKTLDFIFSHTTTAKAWSDQIGSINTWWYESPYFSTEFKWSDSLYKFIADGPRTNNTIGGDAIFYHFSEVNFIDYSKAKYKIDQAFDRYKSRFLRVKDYFGGIIVDSSAAGDESIVDYMIQNYPENMLVIREPIWVIKGHLGTYGKTGWFQVYIGDPVREPFIVAGSWRRTPDAEYDPDDNVPLDSDTWLTDECDPDKVIWVPYELYSNYRSDIYLSLQNTAGLSTTSTDIFFSDQKKLLECYQIPQHVPDIIVADFYDDEQYYQQVMSQLMQEVPKEKIIYIGIDMGVSGDLAGFAISYFDDWIYREGKKTIEFKTKTPLAIAISRKSGQETCITKIYNLIKDIDEAGWEIGAVVTDQYQSTQLRQDLSRINIYSYLKSVDRTYDPYIFYKLQVYRGYQKTVHNNLLISEQRQLIDTGYKVDHKTSAESKDISDAVVNSVYAIRDNIDYADQISKKFSVKSQLEILRSINKTGVYKEIAESRYKF